MDNSVQCNLKLSPIEVADNNPNISQSEIPDDRYSVIYRYLQRASRANASRQEKTHEDGQYYTIGTSDLQALTSFLAGETDQLAHANEPCSHPKVKAPARTPTDETAGGLGSNHSGVPSSLEDAMTMCACQPTSSQNMDTSECAEATRRSSETETRATTCTATHTSRPSRLEYQPEVGTKGRNIASEDHGSRSSSRVGPEDKTSHNGAIRRESSDVIEDIANRKAEPEQEQARRSSFFAVLRKRSTVLSHNLGSFVNGSYRNNDYRQQRPSSSFRMRAILERLAPSRPKQDPAVYSAFTGAQPVQALETEYVVMEPNLRSNKDGQENQTRHGGRPPWSHTRLASRAERSS